MCSLAAPPSIGCCCCCRCVCAFFFAVLRSVASTIIDESTQAIHCITLHSKIATSFIYIYMVWFVIKLRKFVLASRLLSRRHKDLAFVCSIAFCSSSFVPSEFYIMLFIAVQQCIFGWKFNIVNSPIKWFFLYLFLSEYEI